jgi:type VI secretion system secreted protein Hcp
MAANMCIKIGTIPGESTTEGHANEIDVLSWHWGLTQSASSHVGGGGGSGTADVHDLTITKYVDKASPTLLQQCFYGCDQKEAVLTVIKASGDQGALDFVRMTMSGTVIISAVETGDCMPNDMYKETVSLNFSEVKFEYKLQTGNQMEGATSTGAFSINKKS